jgi:DtxR family Mn-dependent transcriptional regulator
MVDPTQGLSRSVEDYLKAIYSLTRHGEAASTSAVAELLEVQPASVTGMVKRLATSELVEHLPYRGVHLTDEGVRQALRVLRRHRILETYLVERLGFPWEEVHREAERLEHAASDTLVERMAAALEHPRHDPHGAPIPTRAGEIEPTDYRTLAECPPGVRVQIRAVEDEDPRELRTMESRGLIPGARLRLGPPAPEGQVTVQAPDGKWRRVEPELARRIHVAPDAEPEP